ncbi:MAG: porin family protein [Bacteroidales bacterium]
MKFILLIVIFLSSFIGIAQNPYSSPTYGLKGGFHLSSLHGDDAMDTHGKLISPQLGITGALFFTPRFSVNAEANYEKKGGKFNSYEIQTNLNYVAMPVFIKYAFFKDPQIYIYGGGYASYLVSANTKGEFERFEFVKEIDEDIKPNVSAFDFGAIIGFGVQGRFNRSADIFLDLRYCQGFYDIDKHNTESRYNINDPDPEIINSFYEVDKPKSVYNRSFMLTTGMYFYLIKR